MPLTDAAGNVIGSFTGTATLSSLATSADGLVGNLLLNGTAVLNGVTTAVTDAVGTAAVTTPGTCPVLALNVGQIHLNLLGLDVSLSRSISTLSRSRGQVNSWATCCAPWCISSMVRPTPA